MTRLYQRVADAFRRRIEDGHYAIGTRLAAERLLAEEFNVSRPTVREAMIALEITGYVEVRVGSGVYVVSHTGNAIRAQDLDIGPFEVLEARRVIESEVAALAAERIDDVQLQRLEKLLDDMRQENATGASDEVADRLFHLGIAEATQNAALVATVDQLSALRKTSPMLINMHERAQAEGIQPFIDDHQRILTALRRRQSRAARRAMSDHLERVTATLLRITDTDTSISNEPSAQNRR